MIDVMGEQSFMRYELKKYFGPIGYINAGLINACSAFTA